MADAMYPLGREGFLDGSIDWDTDDIRVILLTSGYSYGAGHEFVSDLTPGSNEVDRSGASLASKSVALGVCDANDHTLTAVGAGPAAESIVIYKYNVADAAARLIAFIDGATGLPVTPNGGDITIAWDDGANKIFNWS